MYHYDDIYGFAHIGASLVVRGELEEPMSIQVQAEGTIGAVTQKRLNALTALQL